ncbi:MAG: phosphate ABC transporter permease PstA [Sedimentisphaerales bacterium]|nr:phosphate ABC transporter permease PstA [Sedimentisphaerales bacterium]
MTIGFRQKLDALFTSISGLSVILMTAALVLVLGPILLKGASAVVFRGTVEFRQMQLELFGRGNVLDIQAETTEVEAARNEVYSIIDHFKKGIDADVQIKQARDIYREYGRQLRLRQIPSDKFTAWRQKVRKLRDALETAYTTSDEKEALEQLDFVLSQQNIPEVDDTAAGQYFQMARDYRKIVTEVGLDHKEEYADKFKQVEEIIKDIFGPRPGESTILMASEQFGMTRWDRTLFHLNRLLWVEEWVEKKPGEPLVKVQRPRVEQFAGTEMVKVFDLMEDNLQAMQHPKLTIYWQYFFDGDKTTGHFFGGVGPEILGTLLLTILSMLFAFPLGVISAAYLIECAGDNLVIRIIRTCINTLAGVPSIVFGLFGLAFWVPMISTISGNPAGSSIMAGSLTLAMLILPIIIRASEEAIRSVPHTYKEASLSLGASKLRTFVTVQFPAALPGILTGVILSMSRAAGETAPILFTAAVAVGGVPDSLFHGGTLALPYSAYNLAVGDVTGARVPHNQFGMVMTLVLLVLLLNIVAIVIRSRVSKKLLGH